MVETDHLPHVGDHVLLQWGLSELVATVEAIRSNGLRTHVLVSVPVQGPNGEELAEHSVSVPLETVIKVLAV
jgi:hypothetical protein